MIEYIDLIKNIDTSDVETVDIEMCRELFNVYREECMSNESITVEGDLIKNAPDEDKGCYVVPKTIS